MAAPLSRTNEIIILSGEGNRVTGEVTRLLAELPVSVNALTGVDLTKVRVALLSTNVHMFHQTPPVNPTSLFLPCCLQGQLHAWLIIAGKSSLIIVVLLIHIFARNEIFSEIKLYNS